MKSFTATPKNIRATIPLVLESISQLVEEGGAEISVKAADVRTLEQNEKLNAMCGDLSRQIRLDHGIGYCHVTQSPFGKRLSKDSWRGIAVAIVLGQESVPNPDGQGQIVLMKSSKDLSKKTFAACIELLYALGSQHGVQWSERNPYEGVKEAA